MHRALSAMHAAHTFATRKRPSDQQFMHAWPSKLVGCVDVAASGTSADRSVGFGSGLRRMGHGGRPILVLIEGRQCMIARPHEEIRVRTPSRGPAISPARLASS
jgi:hypothetical protein